MIKFSDFSHCLFNSGYFEKSAHQLEVCESKNTESGLFKVTLKSEGTFIGINNKCLKEQLEFFNKINDDLSFRKDCDGVCLLKKQNKLYFILIEMKSGYKEVSKKAFYQIIASYMKMRMALNTFPGYTPEEYKELGFIISYPAEDIKNEEVFANKESVMCEGFGTPINRYDSDFRRKKETVIHARDFGLDKMAINKTVLIDNYKVKHLEVNKNKTKDVINLDSYLQ
jgi:hypothetical protein